MNPLCLLLTENTDPVPEQRTDFALCHNIGISGFAIYSGLMKELPCIRPYSFNHLSTVKLSLTYIQVKCNSHLISTFTSSRTGMH